MKYIALDIGNVICYVSNPAFVNKLSKTFNVSAQEASRFFRGFQQIHDLGFTTMDNQLRDHFGVKSEAVIEDVMQCWNDSIQPCTAMISMLNDLIDHWDTKVALLSNIGPEYVDMMPSKLYPIFVKTEHHFSCKVGARKPTKLFYQSFLMQHPEFIGCLFVDDLKENLVAARQIGFKTHLFALDDPQVDDKIQEIRNSLFVAP